MISAEKPSHLHHDPLRRMFHFDFSDVPATESVRKADLRLYKRVARKRIQPTSTYVITIYRLVKDSMDGYAKPGGYLLSIH